MPGPGGHGGGGGRGPGGGFGGRGGFGGPGGPGGPGGFGRPGGPGGFRGPGMHHGGFGYRPPRPPMRHWGTGHHYYRRGGCLGCMIPVLTFGTLIVVALAVLLF